MQPEKLTSKLFALDSIPLFAGLAQKEKEYIALLSEIVEYKKGQSIYEERDPPDYFYCMITGRVELYHPSRRKINIQKTHIETIRRGEHFGSISTLTGMRHTVSARALNDTTVIRIPTDDFNAALRKVPALAVILSRSLSRRLSARPGKDIFESVIIGIFDQNSDARKRRYCQDYAKTLRAESGKRVIVLKSTAISKKSEVSERLSELTGHYHFVLVEVRGALDDIGREVMRQSDICHIVTASTQRALENTAQVVRAIRRVSVGKDAQDVRVIVREDTDYIRSQNEQKVAVLGREITATLPTTEDDYQKAVRRIARQTSGVMLGLVLGSGSAMGFAHIGVLQVLEEERIPIDILAATSIGALIAALWSVRIPAREIEKIAGLFHTKMSILSLVDPVLPKKGLIKGEAVRRFLKTYLGRATFRDTMLPLKLVACDIENRQERVIDSGNLLDAVMASIAIPGVFEPIADRTGVQLVDGGIVNPVPVSVLTKLGVRRIIAVNTLPSPEDIVRQKRQQLSIYDIIVNSFQAMEYSIAAYSCQQADITIHPLPKYADWHEFDKAALFIKEGRERAKAAIPAIRALARR